MSDTKRIKVYTDGSSTGNPGRGGWAAVFIETNGDLSCIYGVADKKVTHIQMELLAPIMALEHLKSDNIGIYTDNEYVCTGISKWVHNWKLCYFQTRASDLVKNKDLWDRMTLVNKGRNIKWNWIKACHKHRNTFNFIPDQIARKAKNLLHEPNTVELLIPRQSEPTKLTWIPNPEERVHNMGYVVPYDSKLEAWEWVKRHDENAFDKIESIIKGKADKSILHNDKFGKVSITIPTRM